MLLNAPERLLNTMLKTLCLLCFVLPATGLAQRTIIVDHMMAAGSHYRDIPAAVVAASHGDIIYCRTGSYSPPTQTAKGVTIIGNGSVLGPGLGVNGLPAGRSFRIVDFEIRRGDFIGATFTGNRGTIQLESIRAREHGMFPWSGAAVKIDACSLVSMHRCETFGSPCVSTRGSSVLLSQCRFGRVGAGLGGGHALEVLSGDAYVAEPWFDASNSVAPAIVMVAGFLEITGTAGSFVQGGTLAAGFAAIHAPGGVVHLDPVLRLNPNSSVRAVVGTRIVRRRIPVATASDLRRGQRTTLWLHGAAGSTGILALSLPPLRGGTGFAGLGHFWLNARSMVIVASGQLSSRGSLSASTTVPAATPLGDSIAVQGITALGGLAALSVPAVLMAR